MTIVTVFTATATQCQPQTPDVIRQLLSDNLSQSDVVTYLGQPNLKTRTASNVAVWHYHRVKYKHNAINNTGKFLLPVATTAKDDDLYELLIQFDRADRVDSYDLIRYAE